MKKDIERAIFQTFSFTGIRSNSFDNTLGITGEKKRKERKKRKKRYAVVAYLNDIRSNKVTVEDSFSDDIRV